MSMWDGRVLHCGPPFGRGLWGGGRERLPIDAVIRPVHGGVKLISLRHACLAAGLLEAPREVGVISWQVLGRIAEEKWGSSIERFFSDARRVGATTQAADARAADLRGAVIGWSSSAGAGAALPRGVEICADLTLTLAILGRRVADMFVASRPPDYSWPALFDNAFEFDDDLCDAPSVTEEPWCKFQWKASNRKDSR